MTLPKGVYSLHLPDLLSDLALILIVAGVTTIIFKRIRQPLVLGYIVAGFLTGPFFSVMPTVVDMENIHIWSEIGIICLMFTLGLEFSFHKLANVGGTAIITAMTEVCGLFASGFGVGYLLGWSTMDSVILGGVLSMSSTTIIIKTFDELGLKGKKFTEIVFGALIVEDIAGIFLMVFMSTLALSSGTSGSGIFTTVLQLMFYLALWLILGIYVIPTLLKKAKDFMNDETLLIVSLGVCFGVVLLFSKIGFSTALGAFVAGSILAGTVFSEKIEHLLGPIKDLFGSVFFISVGMLVDPAILMRYALPIVAITIATIIGKLIFSTLGVLFSGQRLETAVSCGASLAQIGEFAFIIAALGISLKLSSDFIYPVVVSVSVITTFTTPFFIKHSESIYRFVKRLMPAELYEKIENRTSDNQSEREHDNDWQKFLKKYFLNILVSVTMSLGVFELGKIFIVPFFDGFLPYFGGHLLTAVIVLMFMSPLLITLLRGNDAKNTTALFIKSRANFLPLFAFMIARIAIAISLVVLTVNQFVGIPIIWLILPAIIIIVLMSHSDKIVGQSLHMEAQFFINFNEKILIEAEAESDDCAPNWLSEELWIAEYAVKQNFRWAGHALKDMRLGKEAKVNVIKIVSDQKTIDIPDASQKINAGDTIFIYGTKVQLNAFEIAAARGPNASNSIVRKHNLITLREFIAKQEAEDYADHLFCYGVNVNNTMKFCNQNIKTSGIRKEWHCDVIGIKRAGYPVIFPDVQFVINNGDQIWLLGGNKMMTKLIVAGFIEDEAFASAL